MCMECARHKHSYLVLLLISFGNASVFPISPYYPLVAMCYARPEHWLRYSLGSTIACIVGGVAGWLIGALFWDAMSPVAYAWIHGLTPELIESLRPDPGATLFVAIVALAFSPVPYKIVAICAGIFHIPLPLFLIASFVGRAPRMLGTGAVVAYGSQKCRDFVERHLVAIATGSLALTAIMFMYGPSMMQSLSGKRQPVSDTAKPASGPVTPSTNTLPSSTNASPASIPMPPTSP
jgi:membrane protein YqaA with SNARE-associated domain